MPRIPYTATNFAPSVSPTLRGSHKLNALWADVVWAAVTVGKPGVSYLLAHGWHSISDLVVRSHTVYASLREVSGLFSKSSLYEAQDPTEKGATSYFLGMAMAKLFAARLLGTPWLFHVSMIQPMGGTIKLAGKSQPDLVGLRADGSWAVVEAKGRTNGLSSDALNKAKHQTKMVRRINGKAPALRVAVQAYFSPELTVHLDDPDTSDENGVDLDVDLAAAFQRYYAFVYGVTRDSVDIRSVMNRTVAFHTVSETGISIGLDTGIRSLLEEGGILRPDFVKRVPPVLQQTADDSLSVFPDGLVVALDERWSNERMLREPSERQGG